MYILGELAHLADTKKWGIDPMSLGVFTNYNYAMHNKSGTINKN